MSELKVYDSDDADQYPTCDICGAEYDTAYLDNNSEFCGCENCMHRKRTWNFFYCPECGQESGTEYKNMYDDYCGCDKCMTKERVNVLSTS